MADKDALTQAVLDGIRFQIQAGHVASPAAGYGALHLLADGFYVKFSDGSLIGPFGALIQLIQAKGDLLVGTADNAAVRVSVGANGQILMADSTQPAGVRWVDASATASITQVEIDFGATPLHSQRFTIVDANVSPTSQIMAQVAFEAATSHAADEAEMDPMSIICQPGNGQFTMLVTPLHGRVIGAYKVNYLVG